MTVTQLLAILPLLILSLGIVLALLLVAVKRSQRIVQLFSIMVVFLTFISTCSLLSVEPIQVTPLLLIDGNGMFAFLIILVASLTVLAMSFQQLNHNIDVHDEYYLLVLLVVLGAGILVFSHHFASVFLGFELLSISLVGLVGYHRERDFSVEVGFKYLILSATASSFMLLGMAFIYSQTGGLTFTSQPTEIEIAYTQSNFYVVGVLLFIVGLAFKLSLAPLHIWTPDIFQASPVPVTLLMATVSKVSIAVVFIRFVSEHYLLQSSTMATLLIVIAILSMLVGNILALMQTNIKRLLAYSSIAHMGYLLIVTVYANEKSVNFAWESALFYLFAYVLASISLFFILSKISPNAVQHENVQTIHWQGMFWKQPSLAVLALFALLSLAGIPLTAGFIGKFYLTVHATINHAWWLLGGLIAGSGIGLFYYLKLIFVLFDKSNEQNDSNAIEQPDKGNHVFLTYSPVVSYTLIMLIVAFGIFPNVLMQLIATT